MPFLITPRVCVVRGRARSRRALRIVTPPFCGPDSEKVECESPLIGSENVPSAAIQKEIKEKFEEFLPVFSYFDCFGHRGLFAEAFVLIFSFM